MRDPHVQWIEYELRTTWLFDDPQPLEWRGEHFDITLANGVLRVTMRSHFPSEQEARSAVEPFLQDWEIHTALLQGSRREMRFEFRYAGVIDRDPPPPDSKIDVTASGSLTFSSSISVEAQVIKKSYPAVPTNFRANPDVITLWDRFDGYKAGREHLPSMAYFCLTLIESRHEGRGRRRREAAAKALSIGLDVLDKLGDLSTERGDTLSARKMTSDPKPFTSAEVEWLEACIRALIRRMGEIASDHAPKLLTMDQLPKL